VLRLPAKAVGISPTTDQFMADRQFLKAWQGKCTPANTASRSVEKHNMCFTAREASAARGKKLKKTRSCSKPLMRGLPHGQIHQPDGHIHFDVRYFETQSTAPCQGSDLALSLCGGPLGGCCNRLFPAARLRRAARRDPGAPARTGFQAGKVGFAIAAASAVGYSAFVVNVATNLPQQIIAAGSGTAVTNPGTTFDTYVSDTNKIARRWTAQNDNSEPACRADGLRS
jgi:hypothetical protein